MTGREGRLGQPLSNKVSTFSTTNPLHPTPKTKPPKKRTKDLPVLVRRVLHGRERVALAPHHLLVARRGPRALLPRVVPAEVGVAVEALPEL